MDISFSHKYLSTWVVWWQRKHLNWINETGSPRKSVVSMISAWIMAQVIYNIFAEWIWLYQFVKCTKLHTKYIVYIAFCYVSHISDIDLTHWGRVTHICVGNLNIIGPDNGLSPGRRQSIIWANARKLLIGPLGTKFSENLIEIHTFSFKKMRFKLSSGKWRPFCLGLNVLNHPNPHNRGGVLNVHCSFERV